MLVNPPLCTPSREAQQPASNLAKSLFRQPKPYLRKEFLYRCAYCTLHEGDVGAGGIWHYCVEHFRPRKKFPELVCVYGNLYYACPYCNTTKGETWPSDKSIEQGFYFVDPCEDDLYVDHAEEQDDGILKHKTNAGFYTIEHLRLNRSFVRKMRKDRREVRAKIAEFLSLLTSLKQRKSNGVTYPLTRSMSLKSR